MSTPLSSEARKLYSTDDVPAEALEAYGCILLAISAADGEISSQERRWFDEWAEGLGAPAAVVERWAAFAAEELDLEGFIARTRERRKGEWKSLIKAETSINYARTLVYDAIRMARADDNYHPDEKSAVEKAATMLHVDAATLLAIESVVDMEEGLRGMRRALFARLA
ncbi:MAG: hypothetical protein CMP23_14910 [Rickettsiales bacterium]|nr:hypothetical protein [Rickettsiales bacterium]